MPDRDPTELMDQAAEGIEQAGGFTEWVRNENLGAIVMSITIAISGAILTLGETLLAPFRGLAQGASRIMEGTFFAATDVIDAGATATVTSFVDGAAAYLGPAAFPVGVLSVAVALYILVEGFRRGWSPLRWFSRARR